MSHICFSCLDPQGFVLTPKTYGTATVAEGKTQVVFISPSVIWIDDLGYAYIRKQRIAL